MKFAKQRPYLTAFMILSGLHMLAVVLGTWSEDRFGEDLYPGGISWRAPYEMLIFLGIYLCFAKRISLKWLPVAYVLSAIAAQFQWLDIAFIHAVSTITHVLGLSYEARPQDGVILIAAAVLLLLIIRTWCSFSFMRLAHTLILGIASVFLVFVHILVIGVVGSAVEESNLKTLKYMATNEYADILCQDVGMSCYDGPYREDANYPLSLGHDLHPFVYSQFIKEAPTPIGVDNPDNGNRLGGVEEINTHAINIPVIGHQWNTGWTDVSNIDQPEKYIAYIKRGDRVTIMVDYHSAVKARSLMVETLRYFLLLFSWVWIIGGMTLAHKHANMPRFAGK